MVSFEIWGFSPLLCNVMVKSRNKHCMHSFSSLVCCLVGCSMDFECM